MKINGGIHYSVLLAATFSTLSTSEILFDNLPSKIYTGETLNLTWHTDEKYKLALDLVRKGEGNVAWEEISHVFKSRVQAPGSGSYEWVVPEVKLDGFYALWLDGESSPGSGYSNLTGWFTIEKAGTLYIQ